MIFYVSESKKTMSLRKRALFLLIALAFLAAAPLPAALSGDALAMPVLPPGATAEPTTVAQVRPAAVIYFNSGSRIDAAHAGMIQHMVHEAASNLGVTVNEYALEKESDLPPLMEKIADTDTSLVIIIEPRDIDALMKIPGLYPDIEFSVIGVPRPLYLVNVRSLLFKEPEGAFLMGALAALHSKTGTVSFIGSHDDSATRNLAYAFLQGTRYARGDVRIVEQLDSKITVRNAPGSRGGDELAPDIVFVLDEELLDNAVKSARAQKQLLITYNHTLTGEYPNIVLTSLLKHYDLAIYHTLLSYKRGQWRPGTESMGIGNSYLDYVLDSENKNLIPKEIIEQMEMVKDYVAQGAIQIATLPQ